MDYKICSSVHLFEQELSFLKNFFISNGFPTALINHLIKKFVDRKRSPTSPVSSCDKKKVFFSLPYFGTQSDSMSKELKTCLAKFYPHIAFQFVFVNPKTISSLFRFKEKLPKPLLSSVIYKFCCPGCAASYIGSTTRRFKVRYSEHMGISFRTNAPLVSNGYSAIREHQLDCDTPISMTDFEIIGSSSNAGDLEILESLHIQHDKPSLNNKQAAAPLNIMRN